MSHFKILQDFRSSVLFQKPNAGIPIFRELFKKVDVNKMTASDFKKFITIKT